LRQHLASLSGCNPAAISYLVGTPKGRLSKLEKALLDKPWQAVREGVDVKVLPQDQETYVFAQSRARIYKERAMRRRKMSSAGLPDGVVLELARKHVERFMEEGRRRDVVLPPVAGRPPYEWPEKGVNTGRVAELVRDVSLTDYLLMRGLSALLRSNMA
jgi:hypothetical protein